MKEIMKPSGYWTLEKWHDVALLCETRIDLYNKHSGAYKASHKNGWIDEICNHMKQIKKPNVYYTFEKCKELSLLCETRNEFKKKYSNAYKTCYKNDWMNVFCCHMIVYKKKY